MKCVHAEMSPTRSPQGFYCWCQAVEVDGEDSDVQQHELLTEEEVARTINIVVVIVAVASRRADVSRLTQFCQAHISLHQLDVPSKNSHSPCSLALLFSEMVLTVWVWDGDAATGADVGKAPQSSTESSYIKSVI
ncbi:unnamed protein product [Schistocephalus solidus]|uniref:Uncharacterized protein n=1 Tax=Schistocephalus solidus TaxID=70667 RepID=A0A183SGK1_SCHSO|nr:unnamed protein product [Schistocephalus solidus]